jgi:hypothetical protein
MRCSLFCLLCLGVAVLSSTGHASPLRQRFSLRHLDDPKPLHNPRLLPQKGHPGSSSGDPSYAPGAHKYCSPLEVQLRPVLRVTAQHGAAEKWKFERRRDGWPTVLPVERGR